MADREEEVAAAAEEHPAGEEEDTGAQVAPIVRLEEVAISTGEENEEVLLDMKSKLYRFDHDGQQWKERGVGVAKILKHRDNNKVRLLMRQNKTLKICANHYLSNSINLQEHSGSDKSWVWHAPDFSDGEVKNELLCIRFGSVENARRFKETFEEATETSNTAGSDAAQAADLLDSLSVKDLPKSDDTSKEAPPPSEVDESEAAKAEVSESK